MATLTGRPQACYCEYCNAVLLHVCHRQPDALVLPLNDDTQGSVHKVFVTESIVMARLFIEYVIIGHQSR